MTEVQSISDRRRPRRLISLHDACMRRGISVRSYWRDTTHTKADPEGIAAVRDQLWAESVHAEPSENLWLDEPALKAAASQITREAVLERGKVFQTRVFEYRGSSLSLPPTVSNQILCRRLERIPACHNSPSNSANTRLLGITSALHTITGSHSRSSDDAPGIIIV